VAEVRGSLPQIKESSKSNFRLVSVGALVPGKNPQTVLRAFARNHLPGASLTFVGTGPMLEQLQEEAENSGCAARVRFAGLVPREEALRYMLQADLFVSASGGEGLPVAVLEAMACDCCLVLSDIPPHREIAQLEFVPFVPSDDVAAMARAIAGIARATPEQRRAWAQRIRQHCENAFSLERMVAAYIELFHSVNNQR
jgi:glycosyltransferase involved in cell wall biosynthesis